MKRYGRRLLSVLILVLVSMAGPAHAYQCGREHSFNEAFEKSDRAFLIYVTELRLEEDIDAVYDALAFPEGKRPSLQDNDAASNEYAKFISAGYRVVEEFKGDNTYKPRLLGFLGLSTGWPGFVPGGYFLVILNGKLGEMNPKMVWVDFCMVPAKHGSLNDPEFQGELDRFRKLRDGQQ